MLNKRNENMINTKNTYVWKFLREGAKSEPRGPMAYRWSKKDSVALSIYSAELVLANFEKLFSDDGRPRAAIEAAKRWLKHPTKTNKIAAKSAAESAKSAAWSAEFEKILNKIEKRAVGRMQKLPRRPFGATRLL